MLSSSEEERRQEITFITSYKIGLNDGLNGGYISCAIFDLPVVLKLAVLSIAVSKVILSKSVHKMEFKQGNLDFSAKSG